MSQDQLIQIRNKETGEVDSGTGWPSFTKAIPGTVTEREDNTHGMRRIEVMCTKCGGHLGHIFPDGPDKSKHEEGTGARLCINSCALDFSPREDSLQ